MAEFNLGRIKFVWKGVWATGTSYVKDDVIRYGGKTYICVIGHTADASFNTDIDAIPTKWNVMSDGQEWKGTWTINTLYKIGDIVKYGGYLYICNDFHTSAANTTLGLEANQSNWDLFAESFDWKSTWFTSTRYKINDIARYNGILYICNTPHTSASSLIDGLELDIAKWDILHKGIFYRGTYVPTGDLYVLNDIVKYGAGLWICTTRHETTGTFVEANWEQFVEGLEFNDTWTASTVYQPGDIVTYGGYIYVSKSNNTNQVPTAGATYWDLYVTGFKFVGGWGVPNFYEVGNVVTHGGYTYVCVQDNEASAGSNIPPTSPFWARLNSGFEWRATWQNAGYYRLGDVVKYGPSSYTCILTHTADLAKRPDNDTLGTYWNVIAVGSENAVLTTVGDIVYFGGAGPTRLPVGVEGMVLKVNSVNEPTWDYFGALNQVYYVSPAGTDNAAPLNGRTIDRPWKTVQYATQQIEKGVLYPDAANLISRNRQFIQKEVTAWIAAQIAGPIAPFVGGFVYNSTKCERDIGLITDAIVYDISHGGNTKIRQAAISYGSEAAAFYLAGQKEETIAAINFAASLMQSIVDGTTISPYQGTVTQVTDSSKSPELVSISVVNGLISSLTGAIDSADDSSAVFAEIKVNYTINVKTGTFQEVLPIVVPRDTAIVGDELRSARIEPAGILVDNADVAPSLDVLNHIQTQVIVNVIQNTPITPTTGNTTLQVTTRPVGSAGAATAAATLISEARAYINFYVNSTGSAPASRGTNYWTLDEQFYNAINVIEENREFIVDEAIAYANDQSYTYTEAACRRDVNEYLDAIKWDLIYSSNYKTLTAAKLYANAVNGSTDKDMFYVRNGTGIRNCTLAGLTGTLGAPNSYGTRRPTAGAYVSLDPGWGPDDDRAWIINKSCYVQNVTTFGTGCVGLKVDGNLHASGNDSVVANDFTQVLSDGIGAWVTNRARAELVSVFSYYGHIGYLAENGGKIRATNGNSSYGTFGTVSEGVDETEPIITGQVDNKSVEAQIGLTLTDQLNSIYRFEFTNAGVKYNNATFTINGGGINAVTVADEFRDDGVFEVRLTDPGDSSGIGGTGYKTASNSAQTGDATSITLAATDNELSSVYVGMRITLIGGNGVGQFGYIQSYNNGSKIATIYKESTGTAGWDHIISGTTILSSLDVTTSYIIEPRLTFSNPGFAATPQTLPNDTWNDVVFGNYSTTFTSVSATGGSGLGAQFTVLKSGNYYGVTLVTPGTGYKTDDILTIPGTSLNASSPANDITITVLKTVTGAITVFEFDGTAEAGRYVAVTTGSTGSAYSVNGTTWVAGGALPASGNWKVAYGKNNSAWVAIDTAGTATAKTVNGGATWTSGGALPAGTWVNITYGNGRFVAIGTGTSAAYSTDDGATWVAMTSLPSATWTNVTYGAGLFVAVASSGTVAASSANGTSWTSRTIASGNYVAVAFGKNKFVAIPASGTTAAFSNNGTTWGTMTVPSASYTDVSYGQGVFFAVSVSTDAATSEDGINWTSRTMSTAANGFSAITFGNSNETGIWAAVQRSTAGTVASSVLTGCTTQARAFVSDEKITEIRIVEPGSGYASAPSITITDPNNTVEASTQVRKGKGVLANPTFNNRGTGWTAAEGTVTGNGSADLFQTGTFLAFRKLSGIPKAGSNVRLAGINDIYYKLVSVTQLLTQGDYYTATLQLSPPIGAAESPAHNVNAELRIRYSQVRLTGHDFLDIGTGNFTNTNYPNTPLTDPIPANETVEGGGGRVFYTSTDQDGNFRVGDIFSVEQSTGIATLNADAFSISGLQELSLGSVSLGGSGAAITEFSTDPFFTADSDSILSTQRAVKAYISAQIGSGSSALNVNTLTAGQIFVAGNTITTTTGDQINVTEKMYFKGGVDGAPVALGMFLLK